MSLKLKIYDYIKSKDGEWVHSGEIEKLGQEWGYKAETAGRKARELAEYGEVEKDYKNGIVIYKYQKSHTQFKLI